MVRGSERPAAHTHTPGGYVLLSTTHCTSHVSYMHHTAVSTVKDVHSNVQRRLA